MAWVPIPDLGQGLNLDAQPEELAPGVATGGENVRFRSGSAERFKGMEAVYTTPLVIPYHIQHYTVGSTRYVVYAGTEKTYADDGTTQTDITNANNTGSVDDRYTGGVLNGVYIQNNGVDVPQYWGGDTSTNLADLTAWPAGYTAAWMRPFSNRLICGDITKSGVRYRHLFFSSHIADPGTIPTSWDESDATKDVVEQPIAETDGALIDGMALGDLFCIYKDDAIHYARPVSSRDIFQFGRFPGNTGLLARGCLAQTPMGHVFLTPGFDVVLFNGQGEPQSILEGRMRRWLESNMSGTYARRSFLCTNPATYELLICFPSGSSQTCDKAIVWNWRDNTFARRDLSNVTYGSTGMVTADDPWTFDTATETFATVTRTFDSSAYSIDAPRVVFTRTAPGLALFDASEQDLGSSFTATWEQTGMAFDAPERVKLVRGVRPKIDAVAGTVVYVQVGASMTPDVEPTWSDAVPFTVGTDIEAHTFASGRFLSLRFYTTADTGWRVRSCQIDIVPQGAY